MLAERIQAPLVAVAVLAIGTAVATFALAPEPEPVPEIALACPPPPVFQLQLHSDLVIATVPADVDFTITPPVLDDAIVVIDVVTITGETTAR